MEEEVNYEMRDAESTVKRMEAAQKRYLDDMREISIDSIQSLYHDILLSEVEIMREKIRSELYGDGARFAVIDIIRTVCYEFDTKIDELKIKSRKRELVMTRQIIAWMIKSKIVKNSMSLASIGEVIGRDHATVLHACRTVNNLIETERDFKDQMIRRCFEMGAIIRPNKEVIYEVSSYINGNEVEKEAPCHIDDSLVSA